MGSISDRLNRNPMLFLFLLVQWSKQWCCSWVVALLWSHLPLMVYWSVPCCLLRTLVTLLWKLHFLTFLRVQNCTAQITSMSCRYWLMLPLMETCFKSLFAMMSEALGSIYFPRVSLRCCYTVTDLLELIKHESSHTRGHTVVTVNVKLTKKSHKNNLQSLERRLYQVTDLGRAV